jgi:hypothetical protein
MQYPSGSPRKVNRFSPAARRPEMFEAVTKQMIGRTVVSQML